MHEKAMHSAWEVDLNEQENGQMPADRSVNNFNNKWVSPTLSAEISCRSGTSAPPSGMRADIVEFSCAVIVV